VDKRGEDVVALTHVCRAWRGVFVSRPSLWTDLNCVDEDKTHIGESPDHFESDRKHKKQPEVHRSALPKAKCPLLKVLMRSRSPKHPDLAGEITEKSLTLKSEKAFS